MFLKSSWTPVKLFSGIHFPGITINIYHLKNTTIMAETDKNLPDTESNDTGNKTTERRDSGVIPPTDKADHVAALSAQKEKKAEEALAKAKQNVRDANIPARLPGDIQRQTL